jgi:hypothetical protein
MSNQLHQYSHGDGDVALLPVGTTTVDGIDPVKDIREAVFLADAPGESNDLSINRSGGQRDIAVSNGAR